MAVPRLRKYREAYHPHWDGSLPKQQIEAILLSRDFGKYLDEVAKEKAWGSALEVMALAVAFYSWQTYLCAETWSGLKCQDEHYTCLHHRGDTDPPFDKVIKGPHCAIRGAAAWASSLGTRETVKRMLQFPGLTNGPHDGFQWEANCRLRNQEECLIEIYQRRIRDVKPLSCSLVIGMLCLMRVVMVYKHVRWGRGPATTQSLEWKSLLGFCKNL